MKKNNLVKLLGIAFIVAIVSTGIFYGLFVYRLSSSTGGRTIVVAAKALKAGALVQAGDVKLVPWASDELPSGAYQSADAVVGSTVFDPVGEGEPLLAARLATPQSGGGADIPTGWRAASVHVSDSSGVLALLHPGQKVDVQVVVGRGGNGGETTVRTALENLKVLSVNSQAEPSSQGVNLPVVTLLARPADADVLALADSAGRVRLTLRNPLDETTRVRAPLSLGAMLHNAAEKP